MHNPQHPGEILKEPCFDSLNLTITEAAKALGVSRQTLSAIVNRCGSITAEMALRLSKALGRSPESWLAMQNQYDLWHAQKNVDLRQVRKLNVSAV